MRITNVKTENGIRLAIARSDGCAIVDAPDAPTNIPRVVHLCLPAGGDTV
jgi:hypothetical protein